MKKITNESMEQINGGSYTSTMHCTLCGDDFSSTSYLPGIFAEIAANYAVAYTFSLHLSLIHRV